MAMSFEPEKFFINLLDFFSILLPGALLTFFVMGDAGPGVLGCRYYELTGTAGWAAFLIASYLFGHIIFLIGAWCLDELYDVVGRQRLDTQIIRLARRDKLLWGPARVLVRLVFKRDRNLAVARAGRIRKESLKPLKAEKTINTFQWSKAFLTVESPACLATVQRFEAASKFFRSLVVVLFILVITWVLHGELVLAGIGFGLTLIACLRYMEQRFKSTVQAYWSVITLAAQKKSTAEGAEKVETDDGGPSHAGGVVFRGRIGREEYLLVEAEKDPNEWELPKGHVEEGEQFRETAVRKVHEETGVWARIREDLGHGPFSSEGKDITVQYYLMEYAGRGLRKDKGRRHEWLNYVEAAKKATHDETKRLLHEAKKHLDSGKRR